MELWRELGIAPGITALIGGGGKTTLAQRLALTVPGTAIFCTSTKFLPTEEMPVLISADEETLREALKKHRAVSTGCLTPVEGKLAAPAVPFPRLKALADFVIAEADGSRRLPFKAHLAFEPVIPEGTDRILYLIGASGFGKPARESAHRLERYTELAGIFPDTPVTPEIEARVLNAEGGFDGVIVNQAVTERDYENAEALAEHLSVPVWAGEVRKNALRRLR